VIARYIGVRSADPPVLELFRVPDRLRLPFVSPDGERCLLTVAAAICFARLELRPCLRADGGARSGPRDRIEVLPFGPLAQW
jgi:hypothetical protein